MAFGVLCFLPRVVRGPEAAKKKPQNQVFIAVGKMFYRPAEFQRPNYDRVCSLPYVRWISQELIGKPPDAKSSSRIRAEKEGAKEEEGKEEEKNNEHQRGERDIEKYAEEEARGRGIYREGVRGKKRHKDLGEMKTTWFVSESSEKRNINLRTYDVTLNERF